MIFIFVDQAAPVPRDIENETWFINLIQMTIIFTEPLPVVLFPKSKMPWIAMDRKDVT